MRTLRAVRAHGGPVVLLAVVVAVVVAAAVLTASVAAAGADDARSATSTPLLLLALVVVPVPALELARRRRTELALVRVRGAHGVRLVGLVAGASVASVAAGGVVGVAAGAVAVRLLHGPWDVSNRVGGSGLAAAGLVTAGAALVAAGCAWLVVREPLATAVRRCTWGGPGAAASFAGLVGGVGVLVAALLAVYQSGADAGADDGGSLVLAGSALIGISAGQVVVWALRAAMTQAGQAAATRSTGVLLGLRRALGTEHAGRLRAVVAAGVVVAAAAGAVTATSDWADDSARLRQGAPLRIALPDAGSLSTLLLTQRLDPDGRWLMAAAVLDDGADAEQRIAWLDLARFDRVAGDFLAPTSADLVPRIAALRDAAAVRTVTGDSLRVGAGTRVPSRRPVTVTLEYVGDEGFVANAALDVAAGATASLAVPDCAEACVVIGLSASAAVEVTELRLGETDLLASERWVGPAGTAPGPGALTLPDGEALVPVDAVAPAPMVTAGDPVYPDGEPAIAEIGGSTRPVRSVGSRPGLPLVEGAGLLGDLPVALAGARGSVADVSNVVLARADTPDDVLAGLSEAGAEAPQRVQPSSSVLGGRDLAEDRIRRVVAGAGLLLGLLVVASGRRRRVRAGRRERAALRLVGVPAHELRRAGLVETTLLAAVVTLATAVGGWVAAATVVDASGLVPAGSTRLPFGSTASPLVVVGAALLVALLVVAGAVLVRVGVGRHSTPVALIADAPAEGVG